MRFALDHVVVVVDTLDGALTAFRDAGFVVLPGGRHDALPTENALVVFKDGTYLELLATRDRLARESLRELRASEGWAKHLREASALARRFLPGLAGPDGVTDFALRAADLDRLALESRRRGYAMTGPVELGRQRPDGQRLEMRLLFPAEPWLPFVIEDRTPMALRIPEDAVSRAHANGAIGIERVFVRTPAVVSSAMGYVDHFDATLKPRVDDGGDVTFGDVRVRLVEGAPPGACGVVVAGVKRLPAALAALGVEGAG